MIVMSLFVVGSLLGTQPPLAERIEKNPHADQLGDVVLKAAALTKVHYRRRASAEDAIVTLDTVLRPDRLQEIPVHTRARFRAWGLTRVEQRFKLPGYVLADDARAFVLALGALSDRVWVSDLEMSRSYAVPRYMTVAITVATLARRGDGGAVQPPPEDELARLFPAMTPSAILERIQALLATAQGQVVVRPVGGMPAIELQAVDINAPGDVRLAVDTHLSNGTAIEALRGSLEADACFHKAVRRDVGSVIGPDVDYDGWGRFEVSFGVDCPANGLATAVEVHDAEVLKHATAARKADEDIVSVWRGPFGAEKDALLVVVSTGPGIVGAFIVPLPFPQGPAKPARLELFDDTVFRWVLAGPTQTFAEDLDGDGHLDVVIRTLQMTGMGPEGTHEFPYNYVFRWNGTRFAYPEALEKKVSGLPDEVSLRRALRPAPK